MLVSDVHVCGECVQCVFWLVFACMSVMCVMCVMCVCVMSCLCVCMCLYVFTIVSCVFDKYIYHAHHAHCVVWANMRENTQNQKTRKPEKNKGKSTFRAEKLAG